MMFGHGTNKPETKWLPGILHIHKLLTLFKKRTETCKQKNPYWILLVFNMKQCAYGVCVLPFTSPGLMSKGKCVFNITPLWQIKGMVVKLPLTNLCNCNAIFSTLRSKKLARLWYLTAPRLQKT